MGIFNEKTPDRLGSYDGGIEGGQPGLQAFVYPAPDINIIAENTAEVKPAEGVDMKFEDVSLHGQYGGEILTGSQLCELLGVSPRTVQKWKSEYSMPFIKAGNICRYEKDEVIAWFKQFRQNRKGDGNGIEKPF